jgi:DNA repair exonuclease SbcCD ATPase subunit
LNGEENGNKDVRKMDFGYPYYYPYTISIRREERRKPEHMEQIITKYMSIAEEIQRRISSIDDRFERIERMMQVVQEIMRRNP